MNLAKHYINCDDRAMKSIDNAKCCFAGCRWLNDQAPILTLDLKSEFEYNPQAYKDCNI